VAGVIEDVVEGEYCLLIELFLADYLVWVLDGDVVLFGVGLGVCFHTEKDLDVTMHVHFKFNNYFMNIWRH
jgi:hypothetical protein